MNEREIMAYIAGLIDGDGSFSIQKLKTKANPLYFPVLQCSSGKKFMAFLKEILGGNLCLTKRTREKKGHGPIYRWSLRGIDNVEAKIHLLLPFLINKKEQAKLMINFCENNRFVRGAILSQDQLFQREKAHIEMMKQNGRMFSAKSFSKQTSTINENPEVWAYIAGIMDSDGSFSIKRQVSNKGTQVKNARYIPMVQLSLIFPETISFILENFSYGSACIVKNKSTRANIHYTFSLSSREPCSEFIKRILPYLKEKKDSAEALLFFCENMEIQNNGKFGISEKELQFRQGCYENVISLNKYGVSKPSLIDLESQEQANKGED